MEDFQNHIPSLPNKVKPLIRERGHIHTTEPNHPVIPDLNLRLSALTHRMHGMPGFVTWRAATITRITPVSGHFFGAWQANNGGLFQINPSSSETINYHLHRKLPQYTGRSPTIHLLDFRSWHCNLTREHPLDHHALFLHLFKGFWCHFKVETLYNHWPWSPQSSRPHESPVPDVPFQPLSLSVSVTLNLLFIWKSAFIIPISKPVSESTSFRPISPLCPAVKVHERLILPILN